MTRTPTHQTGLHGPTFPMLHDVFMATSAFALFVDRPLSEILDECRKNAFRRLWDSSPDQFLAIAEADAIDDLMASAVPECPTLRRDSVYLLEPSEYAVDLNSLDEGSRYPIQHPVERRIMHFALVVPYLGNGIIFGARVTSSPESAPQNLVRANLTPEQIVLFGEGRREPQLVKMDFDRQLDEIDRCLTWCRNKIEVHRRRMHTEISHAVTERRAELLTARNNHARIGFPIRRRADAETYSVPLRRRKVSLKTESPSTEYAVPFEPEFVLADADYEAALTVLDNMRNMLERSPSTTGRLDEPEIRDILLVGLNGWFEGNAAGEVFNGAGKTDILIRVEDRNVFIGECKIWSGPKSVSDALDQLLRYLVWRDTKAALLLFVRDADVSTVTAKAVAAVKAHPNYKRRGTICTKGRQDFVIHTTGDPTREIFLALLPFIIADKKKSTSKTA